MTRIGQLYIVYVVWMVKYNAFSQISSTKCWQLSSASLDWLDALTVCVQQGGTLATVDNQQEQDALSALIPTSISSLPSTGGVWIGLSDILREGTFDTWRDDSPVKLNNNRLSKTW